MNRKQYYREAVRALDWRYVTFTGMVDPGMYIAEIYREHRFKSIWVVIHRKKWTMK